MTNNATRDSVRKLIYESFQGDGDLNQAEKYTIAQVVELIENDIFCNLNIHFEENILNSLFTYFRRMQRRKI